MGLEGVMLGVSTLVLHGFVGGALFPGHHELSSFLFSNASALESDNLDRESPEPMKQISLSLCNILPSNG